MCAAAAIVCAAAGAAAQQVDNGPYGDLFGRTPRPQTQSLDVRGGVFGGYDDNLLAQSPNSGGTDVFDPRFKVPGVTSGFQSSATYGYVHAGRGKSGTVFQFGSTASLQEYTGADSRPLWVPNYGGSARFGSNLTHKISIAANISASYGPYYQYIAVLANGAGNLGAISANGGSADSADAGNGSAPATPASLATQGPVNVSPIGSDIGFATEATYVGYASTGVSITDRFTKRSRISAEVRLDETEVFGQARIENRLARAEIVHNLTRKFAVRVGYGLQDTRYIAGSVPGTEAQNHLFDLGLDYGDGGSISFARYYTLTFTTGLSALRHGGDMFFRVDGGVTLARRMGRTWMASIGAMRGTSYIVGFSDPIFSDSANATVGGQLGRRLNFTTGLTYLRGQNAFALPGPSLVTKNASARLTAGLTQHIGLYGQYSFYQYDVPEGFFSTVAFPPHQNRRSASIGLTFWAPLINQRTARQP
ncbi:MAG: hypothetical protein JWL71_4347 [Acidobacteria bacterium]|nr:hypothetical protein [Acidobacteriota bacterium]